MIDLFKVAMAPEAGDAAKQTLHSGYITEGPRVKEFETALKKFLDVKNLLTVNSCTSALQLAYHLAGFKDQLVIVTPMTCSATVTALKAVGAQIVWADIHPRTGNINPESVDQLLQTYPDAKGIVAVHWGGYPCELATLNELADFHEATLVEDAAHAFGAVYRGQYIGNHSSFVAFSFQAIKHLTTVDGGLLVCQDSEDHARGKRLKWFGIDRDAPKEDNRIEQDIIEAGFKYHMNDVNAAIGSANLKHVNNVLDKHRENGFYYDHALQDIPGIELLEKLPDRMSSYWVYTILVQNRERFRHAMLEAGIAVSQVHSRLDKHTTFRDAYNKQHLPGLDYFSAHQISIPCGWWVTEEDRKYIVDTIRKIGGR